VLAYDPAFAYELGIIVREGLRRMFEAGEDVFYYITLYNENWAMPARPEGVEEGVLRGVYRYRTAEKGARRVQLLAAGPILHQAIRAQELLAEHFDVAADLWSATSFQQLRNDALDVERWNRLHPDAEPRIPYIISCLAPTDGPIVGATDYMKAVPDMISRWVERPYTVLGTDGFGRSDTREALRVHFEVSPEQIAYAALYGLCLDGASSPDELRRAIELLKIDPERVNPQFA
jgi:pyruvate dehydrogenase E1 component